MLELNDYLTLTVDDARAQWRSALSRGTQKRQEDFTPVETLLSLGLGQLGTVSKRGNVNIRESDPNAQKLAAVVSRPTKSIAAKLGNLDGRRPHGAKHEQEVWNKLTNDWPLYMELYQRIMVAAREVGITEEDLPDFLGYESKTLEAVIEADRVSSDDLRESLDGDIRRIGLDHPDWDLVETERSMVGSARIGQLQFARRVLENCNFACVFCGLQLRSTGLPPARMLIASHIKPWRYSTSYERRDFLNGVAACPTHDAAFDSFLMTISTDLSIQLSPQLAAAIDSDSVVSRNFGPAGLAARLILPADGKSPKVDYLNWHSTTSEGRSESWNQSLRT